MKCEKCNIQHGLVTLRLLPSKAEYFAYYDNCKSYNEIIIYLRIFNLKGSLINICDNNQHHACFIRQTLEKSTSEVMNKW